MQSKDEHEHRVTGEIITFSERLCAKGQVREDLHERQPAKCARCLSCKGKEMVL